MHRKQQAPATSQDTPLSPTAQRDASYPVLAHVRAVNTRTVTVRRGSIGLAERLLVPEGLSTLHAGLEQLQQPHEQTLVDEWYVIEV